MDPQTHQENYQRESAQKTMTATELHAKLAEIIAQGNGLRPVFLMEVDGLTHARPIADCIASAPYDGEIVWITSPE